VASRIDDRIGAAYLVALVHTAKSACEAAVAVRRQLAALPAASELEAVSDGSPPGWKVEGG
jgi:hypothetical protein